MAPVDTDRNLLFGLLALQNGLIDQAKLVAAFQAWTLEKARPLAEHLVARGDLDADDRSAVEALVTRHIKKHGGSTEKSLAAIPAGPSTRRSLKRIADPEIHASLAVLDPEIDGEGVLARIAERTGALTCVTLAETESGPELTTANQGEGLFDGAAGRYQVLGEIARGGMGAVHRGRDPDLGRDVALKVLLGQHSDRSELVDRFVEEAQICGQLQHPGVVPVYELGTLADHRPFFTMKLVKGQTLAALLAERSSATDELPRFLGIFESVCQTVAYAHARGVIHRDLKPSNVMVGSFGEVQVMDWGLAKVLPKGWQPVREPKTPPVNETVVATARSKSDNDLSQAGSVLGTPAYMAPEQARGETEAVDRRADVFALGSILCEILTGRPAFGGETAIEILRAAGRGDTAAALDRLAIYGADEELLTLARDCLAAQANDRPADAGVVADRLTAYLSGVQERLREAELHRAAESARAQEAESKVSAERRARRLTAALAATVLLAGVLGSAGWRWVELQRLERVRESSRRVNVAIQGATRLRGLAQGAAVGDLGPWEVAVVAAEKARELLEPGVEPGLRTQVGGLLVELAAERGGAKAAAEAAERDRRLLDRLADIRSARADDRVGDGTGAAYGAAFREAGIDLDELTPEEAGNRIKARPAASATAMAMALDDWAAVRRDLRNDAAGAKRLIAVARSADPDPWRNNLRDALEIADRPARRARLTALAASIKGQELPPVSFDLLGNALGDVGAKAEAESVLRRGRRAHPGNVWLNYDLARALESLSRREEAIRYYTAARMIRPETAHELAHALRMKGESDEAIDVFRDLVRIRPGNGRHLSCMGHVLLVRGFREEARRTLTEAVTALRQTIAARPDDFYAHLQLGNTLRFQNRLDESLAMYREAARLKPTNPDPLDGMGWIFLGQGRHDEAAAIYRDSLRLAPENTVALEGLGSALQALGRIDEAIELYRKALRISPDDSSLHFKLGGALSAKGRFAEALAEKQEAARLTPDDSTVLHGLGLAFRDLGRFDEAEAAFRKSLVNQPDNPDPLNSLAWLLATAPDRRQRRPEDALKLARQAVQEAPDVATNYNTLGVAEYRNGLWDEAIATLNKSIAMCEGTDPTDFFFLAVAHRQRGDRDQAERAFHRGVEVARKNAPSLWEWRMIWAEAAELLGKPGHVPTLYEVTAEPDRAMATLHRMAAAGFVQPELLRASRDLEPLRTRRDFQLLALDLTMPAQPFAQ